MVLILLVFVQYVYAGMCGPCGCHNDECGDEPPDNPPGDGDEGGDGDNGDNGDSGDSGNNGPSNRELAQEKTEQSENKSTAGEGIQNEAESAEGLANEKLTVGEGDYSNASVDYQTLVDNLSNADQKNGSSDNNINNAQTNNKQADEGIQNTNDSIDNSLENKESSQEKEEESKTLLEKIQEGVSSAANKLGDAIKTKLGFEEKEEEETEKVVKKTENANSEKTGDPVRYTTGEYVSKSTDIKINNIGPELKVVRNYANFNNKGFSFARGWSFNYDTRLITGIKADYIEQSNILQNYAEEINDLYNNALINYEDAINEADESIRLAGLGLDAVNKAISYAENAKNRASLAEENALSAKEEAVLARQYGDQALINLNNSIESANSALQYGAEAETAANNAREKAVSALNLANQARNLANSAVTYANRTGSQSLKNAANAALNKANTLINRAQTSRDNMLGSNGKIKGAQNLQESAQGLLNEISNTKVAEKINNSIQSAGDNKADAEEEIARARGLFNLADEAYQNAEETLLIAQERLNQAEEWKDKLVEDYSLVEELEGIKNEIDLLAEQGKLDREYSEIYRYRNQYTVDWNANPVRDEIGVGKLILVDEEGTPHVYEILTEPDYDTEIVFDDGRKNYYPNGSQTRALNPIDDKVEILSDGSYLLTKKDGTKYTYSYYGQISKIEDSNGRYLDFTYNSEKELVKVTDSFQRELKISRSNGRIRKITDPLGREYIYGYSGDRLVSYTDPEGNTRKYTYNGNVMTATIYPDGGGWNYYYTEVDGKMVMDYQTDAAGAEIDFEYDPDAQKTTLIGRRGYQRTYRYNENHLTIEEIDADYYRIVKSYDENNNLISVSNKRGYTTRYTYDQNNNITGITDSVGTTSFTYNQFNKISTVTDKKGNTTGYSYDHRGNLISINYPDGSSKSFQYNQSGLLTIERDQHGNQTRYSYDQYGNPTEKINPDGSIEKYQYDQVGRLIKLTKVNGGEISYTYDRNDNIVKVVDELGNEESFKYNSRNKVIEKTDPLGNITKYEYDERNNLKKIIDPAGNVQEIEYDEAENMTKKILAENVSYIYQYDNLDRLTSTTQLETDISTNYQYDPAGNITALTDGEGRTTKYEYDALNRKIREKDPLNNTVSYRYYADNSLKSVTDKKGNTSYFKYDRMGRLIEVIDALNKKVKYEYDSTGNLTTKTDARGNSTKYEYDSMNRLIKEIDPLGNETIYNYNQTGELASVTDPEGNTLSFEYDLKGRVITETNALGDSKSYQYDAVGNLISQTNEAGVTSNYKYNQLNRLIEIEDSLGNITKIGYTPLGKVAWREDALGNRVEFEYDSANRLTKETDPEGNSIKYSYDKAGNMTAVTDEMGNITEYHYDKLNRMIETVDALNNKIEYSYDANNNLVEMVNRNGNNYQYKYDELDRLVKEINYLGNEQNYSYDPNGNLNVKIDFNGNKTNYNYDELNRLLETIFADGSKKEFSYNANGMMTAADNENSSQRYYYDELSRLIKTEVENENGEYVVEYQYNQLGQRTKITLDDGNTLKDRETRYEYDEASRLSKVELPGGEVVKYRYDQLNRVITQINSNRTGTNYSYTPDGQVETITHYQGLRGHHSKVLQSYGYIYNDRNQRLMEVEGSGEITTYQYDPVGRLTKVYYPFSGGKKEVNRIERSNYFGLKADLRNTDQYYRKKHNPDQYISEMTYQLGNEVEDLHKEIKENGRPIDFYNNGYYIEEYKYDPAGNVVQEANAWGTIDYQYNAANQLVQAGARSYEYDRNGNLIKDGYKKNYAEYQYNYENRLLQASNLSRDNKLLGGEHPFSGTIDYTYDALGRKISKKLTPNHGNRVMFSGYYYDGRGTNVLADYEDNVWNMKQYQNSKSNGRGNGNIQGGHRKYLNEYYYGNGLIAFNNMNNPNPGYMSQDMNFYHKDVLGSITAITGRNGNIVERYRYGAYGNPYQGRFLNMQKNNPYGFTGQRYEAELRLYSFAYRTYNPVSMRWMTVDPVRDGMNWYQYGASNPIMYIDILGLCAVNPDEWRNVMKNQQPMMKGSDVEELQKSLNEMGIDITVDGYYGNETANAVKEYQTSKGLGVDGKVGPNTREEIKKDLGIEDETETADTSGFEMPVGNPVIRKGVGEYGVSRRGGESSHKGVDFLGNVGDTVKAAKGGKVVVAYNVGAYGNVVYLDHDDRLSTRYAHLDSINVNVGDAVNKGEQIGTMGRTGNVTTEPTHLHFEVRQIDEGAASSVRNTDTEVLNPNKVLPIDTLPSQ